MSQGKKRRVERGGTNAKPAMNAAPPQPVRIPILCLVVGSEVSIRN